MKRYLFTVMMLLSVLAAIPVMWQKLDVSVELPFIEKKMQVEQESVLAPDSAGRPENTGHSGGVVVVPRQEPEKEIPDLESNIPEAAEPEIPEPETPESEMPEPGAPDKKISEEEKTFLTVDKSYWEDALFIGDSRTVGLSEYADLGGADVFADSGMSVYKVFTKKLDLHQSGKQTLEEILSEKQYGKIYIMLGINELGYNHEKTVEMYADMLDKLQELQPKAILFLEANLHVTEEQSSSDKIFNNAAINKINQAIKEMADNKTRFFVDINEVFDDAQGNLDTVYTADSAHVLGKHYTEWADWLMTKGIS